MTRRRIVAVAVGLLAATLVTLFFLRSSPGEVVRDFVAAWEAHDWARMDELARAEGALAERFEGAHEELGITGTQAERGATEDGIASVRVTHTIHGVGEWAYTTRIGTEGGLLRSEIVWDPAILHPSLGPGLTLRSHLEWPDRAPLLGANGERLTIESSLVVVGLEPGRIADRDETLAALEEELGLLPEDVSRELDRPGVQPDWFVPLVRLREELYQEQRPDLAPIPGVVFRREPARITPTPEFGRHVVGRTGEITAERLEELGPPYATGDVVGLSGLERLFEERLAGSPGAEIHLIDEAGDTVEVLHAMPATEPEPVRTTINRSVQQAAEDALEGVEGPAAIVAVDAGTGGISAATSRPLDEPFNRARDGRYPPGSTFKVVTAAGALDAGRRPETTISCPAEITVGRPFRNAGGRDLGEITLQTAFVESCNTAFVQIADELGADRLAAAAEVFGFGASYDLPLPASGGRFPEPTDTAELAAAGIGQGRVEASPLHMASVAAAVADGSWRSPSLLPGDDETDARELDEDIALTLQEWMRAVVQDGTGTAAGVPGAGISGKTGTAEFGTGDERGEHAWFIGFSGNLAFAVLIEGGGSGGEVAAPIAARFVEGLD